MPQHICKRFAVFSKGYTENKALSWTAVILTISLLLNINLILTFTFKFQTNSHEYLLLLAYYLDSTSITFQSQNPASWSRKLSRKKQLWRLYLAEVCELVPVETRPYERRGKLVEGSKEMGRIFCGKGHVLVSG